MIRTPKFWRSVNIFSVLLFPISLLYLAISSFIFYLRTAKKFKTKIICIGNVIAGGSGKTPSAIMLGKILTKHHYKVAFACKNYLAPLKGPVKVNSKHTTSEVIEEALLLSAIADTFVAKSLLEAIELADDGFYDFIITDDGFQNNKFKKDMSILVVDGLIGFGNGLILPAGPLREPLAWAVKRADLVFMIGANHYESLSSIKTINLSQKLSLSGNADNYTAFTGIAYPEKFFNSLREQNLNILETIEYPDHKKYSEKDLDYLVKKAEKNNSSLITTEKDFIKIPSKYRNKISILKLELVSEDNEIIDMINQL